jgi:hypothetical protein
MWVYAALFFASAAAGDIGPVMVHAGPMDMSALQGRWMLESINRESVSPEYNLHFKIEGRLITGFDGCNNFGGSLDNPDLIRKGQRACTGSGPRLPLQLSDPLPQLNAARLVGDELIVPLSQGTGEATFRRR